MSIFDRRTWLYLRHPNGGVEDVAAMRDAGYDGILLATHAPITLSNGTRFPAWSLAPWQTIIARAISAGMPVAPWGYVKSAGECAQLRRCAIELAGRTGRATAPACFNAEAELRDGLLSIETLVAYMDGLDALFTTEGTPYHSVDWSRMPAHVTIEAQLFGRFPTILQDARGARALFYAFGAKRVRFLYGITDGGVTTRPEGFPPRERGLYSVFTGDNDPRLEYAPAPVAMPLPASALEYGGPLYPPGHPRYPGRPMRHRTVKLLKLALHEAGYESYTPALVDDVYNRRIGDAIARMQRHYGIAPTGAYGLATWERFLRLPTALPTSSAGYRYHALTSARAKLP